MSNRFESLNRYELLHVVDHLMELGLDVQIGRLLTDEDFLERKAASGMVSDIAREMRAVLRMPKVRAAQPTLVGLAAKALLLNQSFIERHPETLFQCMWNACHWRGTPGGRHHFEFDVSFNGSWGSDTDRSLSQWMQRWRSKKEADRSFCWIRHLRPPANTVDLALAQEFKSQKGTVFCVGASPDGRTIASGSTGLLGTGAGRSEPIAVVVWDAEVNRVLAHIEQPSGVNSLVFSRAGDRLAAVLVDETVRVWAAPSCQLIKEFKLQHSARSIAFAPDGSLLLFGCHDGIARVIDWFSGVGVLELKTGGGHIVDARYAGDHCIVTGTEDGNVGIWSAVSAEQVLSIAGPGAPVRALAVSSDGQSIAVSYGRDIFETPTQDSESDLDIHLFDVFDGRLVRKLSGPVNPATCLAYSSDGGLLAAGGGHMVGGDRTIRLWDLNNEGAVRALPGHAAVATALAFLPDGTHLLSSAQDGTVRLWSLDVSQVLPPLQNHGDDVFGSTFSPDGRLIATSAWDDRRILIWNARDGSIYRVLEGHESLIRCFRFSEDSRLLISGSGSKYGGHDCGARVWDIESGHQLMLLRSESPGSGERHGHVNPVKLVGFIDGGQRAVTGHADLKSFTQEVSLIRIWDLRTGTEISSRKGSSADAGQLTYGPDDKLRGSCIERFIEMIHDGTGSNGGEASTARTVAGWLAPVQAALLSGATETKVIFQDRPPLWLPETFEFIVCACPTGLSWAAANANHLMIFAVSGSGVDETLAIGVTTSDSRWPARRERAPDVEALVAAVDEGDAARLEKLLRGEPRWANTRDSSGDTLLHRIAKASLSDGSDVAEALLDAGADPNSRDGSGATPLHWASARPWKINFAEVLLKHGADPEVEDDHGHTPLASASRGSTMFGSQMLRLLEAYVVNRRRQFD